MGEYRPFSVHHALGGRVVADLLLWKDWYSSVSFLVGSTALWFIFEIAGYNILSFISNVLSLLVVILFLWAKSASILNRPLPPLPNLELSEKTVLKAADHMRVWLNCALSVAHDIAIVGDLRLFIKVVIGLWVISYLGSFVSLITLVYICILLSLSLPVLYDKYQNPIVEKLSVANQLLQKIPLSSNKKKIQ